MAENILNTYRLIVPVSDFDKAPSFYTRLLGMKGREIRGGRHYLFAVT